MYSFHRLKPQFLFFLVVLVMGCPVVGQPSKMQLTEADYKLWHQLTLQHATTDGKWVQYGLAYKDTDTIVVKNAEGNKKYTFSNAQQPRFFNDHYFACIANKVLTVIDLNQGNSQVYKGIRRYEIMDSFLAVYGLDKVLSIYNRAGQLLMKEEQVMDFYVPATTGKIAFVKHSEAGNTLKVFDAVLQKTTMQYESDDGRFQGLKWKPDGTSLFFMKYTDSIPEFHCIERGKDHLLISPGMQNNMIVATDMPIVFSADGKRIFYHVREKNVKADEAFVQIWNAKDRWLYSKDQEVSGYHGVPLLTMWDIENEKASMLGSVELPDYVLNSDQNYAILYHPEANPDSFHYPKEEDLFLTDLHNGTSKIWLPKFSGADAHLQFSPDGRFAAYFKEGQWFVYEFKNQTTYDTTKLIQSRLENATDILATEDAFGLPGWSSDGKSLLIYDKYDVWLADIKGSNIRRLTNGKETDVVYRIVPRSKNERVNYESGCTGRNFNLEKGFFLEGVSTDFDRSVLAFWDGKKAKLIYKTYKKLRNIKVVNDGLIFSEESHAVSPRIIKVNLKGYVTTIAESNMQQKKFEWSRMEVLTYTGSKGKQLHGLLYYPAHYDASQKYPMVVNVYEKIIQNRQLYLNPSMYNSVGINRTNLCAKGYFVLLPDIDYDASGGVAQHALVCVSAAIEEALKCGSVNRGKIGLTGHSFGGYETDLLITQTPMFACAIAGAAVTDMVSSYLLEAKNQKVPNYFRNEAYQFRMGTTLWDDRDSYLLNSPVYNADKIETPLLSWAGSLDGQVQSSQTTELYFALRRLGREHIMLIYRTEEHALDDRTADADLTRKCEEWFGYFLKDEPLPDWMKPR